MDVLRAAQFADEGVRAREVVSAQGAARIHRIRHGAYVAEVADDAVGRHRQLIDGTWPLLGDAAVLSHASAAILHGLPVWDEMLDRVAITRPEGGHGRREGQRYVRYADLADFETVAMDQLRLTSLERTAVDVARMVRYDRAVAVLDAALHQGADPGLLDEIVQRARKCRGAGVARRALVFADGRSESVAESISRVRMSRARITAPELQVNIFDEYGTWVARSDFGWLALGVVGEFDGRIKYQGTAEEVARAVMKEKAREARIRELGWVVVRWDWADLADLDGFRRRIESAFAQANPSRVRGWAVAS